MKTQTILISALLTACGTAKKTTPDTQTTAPTAVDGTQATASALPDLTVVDLGSVALAPSADLTDAAPSGDADCDLGAQYGAGGIALSSACHANRIVEGLLYGSHRGPVTCADYDPNGQNQGFLLSMLCQPTIVPTLQLETVRFEQDGSTIGISFTDEHMAGAAPTVGSWTATGPDSGRYPGDIRVWKGATEQTLNGILALNLVSAQQGTVYVDWGTDGATGLGQLDFQGVTDTTGCQASPTATTCDGIDLRLAGPEDGGAAHGPSSVHLHALGAAKWQPSFLVIEGKLRYSDAAAAAAFGAAGAGAATMPAAFANIRTIYFRAIRAGNQIWGSYDLQGADGKTLAIPTTINGQAVDLGSLLRNGANNQAYAGLCQNLGAPDAVACTAVTPSNYSQVWEGDAQLDAVQPTFALPAIFSGAPTQEGLVTAEASAN